MERVLALAASVIAMAVPTIPLIWLLRLPDDEFHRLIQGIGLREFRLLEVVGLVTWVVVVILLNRLFERLLDHFYHRPRTPWLK